MALKCESGYVYCRNVADGVCVICRRYFCAHHGNVAGPYCRRCKRAYEAQQAAAAAEVAEVTRREVAAQHNAEGHCGWIACDGPLLALCQHCGLQYCSQHSNRYRYSYRYRTRRGIETRHATVVLCDACKPALRLYKREKTWLEV
jgi:hypothetical protein